MLLLTFLHLTPNITSLKVVDVALEGDLPLWPHLTCLTIQSYYDYAVPSVQDFTSLLRFSPALQVLEVALNIGNVAFPEDFPPFILPSLHHLMINEVAASLLTPPFSLPKLTSLTLTEFSMPFHSQHHPSPLLFIEFIRCDFSPADLIDILKSNPNLEAMTLNHCTIDSRLLDALSREAPRSSLYPKLRCVRMDDCAVPGDAVVQLLRSRPVEGPDSWEIFSVIDCGLEPQQQQEVDEAMYVAGR